MKKRLLQWGFGVSLLVFLGSTNLLFANQSSQLELSEAPKNITWVDIVIDSSETTLEDLASTYYGDVKEANFIYESNKDVIPKSRRLAKGMKLKIVVNNNFIDQPEHLGWH
jgi:hypothetical protein